MKALLTCALLSFEMVAPLPPTATYRPRLCSGVFLQTKRTATICDAVALSSYLDNHFVTTPNTFGIAAAVQHVANTCAQTSYLLERASLGSSGECYSEMSAKLFDKNLAKCPGISATAIQWPGRALRLTKATVQSGNLVIVVTPLDSEAGTEVVEPSASVGSVFAVYEAAPSHDEAVMGIVPRGQEGLLVSGYCVYSSSTQLVLAVRGELPNAFTLDPSTQSFIFSEEGLRVPEKSKTLIVDYSCSPGWPHFLTDFVADTEAGLLLGTPLGSRFSGSTVADVHRILTTGGCLCHPAAAGCGPGLPFLSMVVPLAFIIKQAGGKVLCHDNQSTLLSAASPLYLGSLGIIDTLEGYLDGEGAQLAQQGSAPQESR